MGEGSIESRIGWFGRWRGGGLLMIWGVAGFERLERVLSGSVCVRVGGSS